MPKPPPLQSMVYHCFAARGAGACIIAGTVMKERARLEPRAKALAVMPMVCAMRRPGGVLWVKGEVMTGELMHNGRNRRETRAVHSLFVWLAR
jgi:hypothetical protein